jgi:hypothetical protein
MSIRTKFAAALFLTAFPLVASAQDPTALPPVSVVGSGARVMIMPSIDGEIVPVLIPAEFEGRTTITVENWRDEEVTLIAQDGAASQRLGVIPANSRVTLALPQELRRARTTMQLIVDTGGVQKFLSDTRRIVDGEHLAVRVPPR